MVSGAYKTEFGESDEISQCMKKVNVSHFRCKKCLVNEALVVFLLSLTIGTRSFTGALLGRGTAVPVTPPLVSLL